MSHKIFLPHHTRRLSSAFLFVLSAFAASVCGCVGARAEAISKTAETDGAVWLERLAHIRDLNFRGVLTYARGDYQESLRVTHGLYNGELYERLEHLDGERREVIRRGERLTCIQLGQRFERLFNHHLLKAGLANIESNYTISIGEGTRIAGRDAVALNIAPRDEFRYGYRLLLDRDTALPLRVESINHVGNVLERLQFVDVQIGEPLRKEWLGDAVTEITKASAKTAESKPLTVERVVEEAQMAWKPRWLPPGFSLALAPHKSTEDALTYADGLAVFSVFVEAAKEPLPSGDGNAREGATVAYARPVQINGNPFLILVVGEVPAITAKRVADSVMWIDSNALPVGAR